MSPSVGPPPVPIGATLLTGPERLQIFFDRPLDTGSIPTANQFRVHLGAATYTCTGTPVVAGSSVAAEYVPAPAHPTTGTCDWLGGGTPILAIDGAPAAPFAGLFVGPF